MATPTWPTFPCEREPEVEIIGGRTVNFETEAGTVWPLSLWTGPKMRFSFNYRGLRANRAAPAPYAPASEIATVVNLVADLEGAAGLVYVINPIDGLPVLCRLEADSASFRKVPKTTWYAGSVSFISV